MNALFKSRLKWLAVPSIVGLLLCCALAAHNPGIAQDSKNKKGVSDPFTSVLASTDPLVGYLGSQESLIVDTKTLAAAGVLLCSNYVTGQQELVPVVLTLEGGGTVLGFKGHIYKTNLDPSKYSTTDLFLSDDNILFTSLYPVYGKTATGDWNYKDACTRTPVAGTGDSSMTSAKPSAY